jgi:peptide deformylase
VAVRAIRTWPDPVLRVRCHEVTEFDEELGRLVADMIETMHAAPGIGLAASQVGDERRVAVVDLSVGKDPADLLVLVNPEIVADEGVEVDEEGCLSIPDYTDKVARPFKVEVKAQDAKGEPISFVAEDWLARAICHELDHLDGILFVDRLHGLRRERAKRHLKRLVKDQQERQWEGSNSNVSSP